LVRLAFISPFHIRVSDAEVSSSVPEVKDLWQNSASVLTTATKMLGRRIKGNRRVRGA